MKMDVFVLGEGGIGGAIADLYRRNGHKVYSFKKSQCDVTSLECIHSTLSGMNPELVFNCAGVYSRDSLEEISPALFKQMIDVQVIGTYNILRVCREVDATPIILSSIMAVKNYNRAQAYALSKRLQEAVAQRYSTDQTVFLIRPKMVDTPMFRSDNPTCPRMAVMQPHIFAKRLYNIINNNPCGGVFEI
jgi:nucleoside-diphosphate-sugar epimerase